MAQLHFINWIIISVNQYFLGLGTMPGAEDTAKNENASYHP